MFFETFSLSRIIWYQSRKTEQEVFHFITMFSKFCVIEINFIIGRKFGFIVWDLRSLLIFLSHFCSGFGFFYKVSIFLFLYLNGKSHQWFDESLLHPSFTCSQNVAYFSTSNREKVCFMGLSCFHCSLAKNKLGFIDGSIIKLENKDPNLINS